MSLSLVVGILVSGLAGLGGAPAAQAQTGRAGFIAAPAARIVGAVIIARGVVVNGVAVDAVFLGGVRISNSVVEAGRGITRLGVNEAGGRVYVLGAFPSGENDPVGDSTGAFPSGENDPGDSTGAFPSGEAAGESTGAFPSGELVGEAQGAFPSGGGDTYVGTDSIEVVGGTLQGDNIQVTGGVITGENLVLTGTCVTGGGAQ